MSYDVYSYDRRAGSESQLIRIIVQKIRDGRAVDSLVEGLIDELREDWEDTHGRLPDIDNSSESQAWEERNLGILHDAHKAEQAFAKVYVETYMRAVPWADRRTALEVMDYPDGLPSKRVPLSLLVAVAKDQATGDAMDARALREMALSRQ